MKTKILILAMIIGGMVNAQCTQDTFALISYPVYDIQLDTLTEPTLPCYGYGCDASVCHSWQLPNSIGGSTGFVGHLSIWSDQGSPIVVNFQILQDCHLIRMDSCVPMLDPTQGLSLVLQFPYNSQVVVCGPPARIGVGIKGGFTTDTLPAPFLNTDTLCGPFVPIPEPVKEHQSRTRTIFEFDGTMWRKVDAMLPNRMYKRF